MCRYYVIVAWIWAVIWYFGLDPIKWALAYALDEEGMRTGKRGAIDRTQAPKQNEEAQPSGTCQFDPAKPTAVGEGQHGACGRPAGRPGSQPPQCWQGMSNHGHAGLSLNFLSDIFDEAPVSVC